MEDRKAFSCRSIFCGKFLLSVFVIGIAAAGLRPGMHYLAEYYSKETIAVNRLLKEFDISCLPSYRQGWIKMDLPMKEDIETDEYILIQLHREDTIKIPSDIVLLVTYYSDPSSKVPHTPDVCYRQSGAIVEQMESIEIDVPNLPSGEKQVEARQLKLKMPDTGNQGVVIFSFCAEGLLRCTREQTRLVLGKPGNKYTYFAKVEVVAFCLPDADPSSTIAECKRLYSEVMPVLLSEYFPKMEQLKR